jgi:hypothetical protein
MQQKVRWNWVASFWHGRLDNLRVLRVAVCRPLTVRAASPPAPDRSIALHTEPTLPHVSIARDTLPICGLCDTASASPIAGVTYTTIGDSVVALASTETAPLIAGADSAPAYPQSVSADADAGSASEDRPRRTRPARPGREERERQRAERLREREERERGRAAAAAENGSDGGVFSWFGGGSGGERVSKRRQEEAPPQRAAAAAPPPQPAPAAVVASPRLSSASPAPYVAAPAPTSPAPAESPGGGGRAAGGGWAAESRARSAAAKRDPGARLCGAGHERLCEVEAGWDPFPFSFPGILGRCRTACPGPQALRRSPARSRRCWLRAPIAILACVPTGPPAQPDPLTWLLEKAALLAVGSVAGVAAVRLATGGGGGRAIDVDDLVSPYQG